jgi:nitrate/TMAO reductase-like tetraheme cytochrome c subunit
MRKTGFLFSCLLLAGLVSATGQELPKPLPEDDSPAHAKERADQNYPSARVCGKCHPGQYAQWSVSSHAYAALSPMFNKFEQTINNLSQGTVKYFCVRCHASVGTALGERRDIAWWNRNGSAREGITCVTCHRVGEGYGKTNAARRISPGDIHWQVFGPFDSRGGLKAISNAKDYQIQVSSDDQPDKPGYLRIHQTAVQSDILLKSELCVACHQVQVHPGIKLEVVWEEYQASPAAAQGITCQECHMSPNPGRPSRYPAEFPKGWAACVNGKTVREDRPLTDHRFIGPGYPISHPGLFPFPAVNDEDPFTPQQWLTFDWRAGWGSDDFESKLAADPSAQGKMPPEWQNLAKRKEAWRRVQANLKEWEERKALRLKLLENGSRLDGPFFDGHPAANKDLSFSYKLTNLNNGHNLPSGSLGAQPELWLNVALIGPDSKPGEPLWESGDLDSLGDLRDLESDDVGRGKPRDSQLFSLQTKFLTTNLKGTDREMYLPVNLDFDQRAFIRPGGTPVSLLNHPPNVRMEKHSIPPLGNRVARYKVPGRYLKHGHYRLAVRLRGRSEPMYFMRFVGATEEMKRSEDEWITDSHAYAVEFDVP